MFHLCFDLVDPFHIKFSTFPNAFCSIFWYYPKLGVSVTRVQSVVFDRWDAEMAKQLLAGGNDKGRALYLANLPRGYAERVVRAPQNSSWADVLRIEAAEQQLAEAPLALRNLRAASPRV